MQNLQPVLQPVTTKSSRFGLQKQPINKDLRQITRLTGSSPERVGVQIPALALLMQFDANRCRLYPLSYRRAASPAVD